MYYYGSEIGISQNGGATAYYDAQSTTGNPDWNGANLGTYNLLGGSSLTLKGGKVQLWRDDAGNYINTSNTQTLYFSIYQGSSSGFTAAQLLSGGGSTAFLGGNNFEGSNYGLSTNLGSSFTSSGTWNIAVYFHGNASYDSGGQQYFDLNNYSNNGGSNYIANITAYYGAAANGTQSSAFTGSGYFSVSGTGTTYTLNQSNTYTGETQINAGNLDIANGGSISASSSIYLGTGTTTDSAQLTLGKSDGGQTFSNNFTINPTSSGATDDSKRIIAGNNTSGTNTYSGTITVNSDATISAASGGTLAFGLLENDSTVRTVHSAGNGTIVLGGTSDNLNIALSADSSLVQLAKTSSSSVHAVGNSAGVALTVNSGATAQLAGSGGDQIYDNSGATINSGGAFDLNGLTETINTISLNGTGVGNNGALTNSNASAATLTISSSSSLAGATRIAGTGDITIAGAGAFSMAGGTTLTKAGNNTLTLSNGAHIDNLNLILQVDAGKVVLNKTGTASGGAHAIGGLTLNSGGTVQLSGTGGYQIYEGANAVVNSGGVLDLNGQSQTFTTGSLSIDGTGISSGGALVNTSGTASTLAGSIALAGNISIGGAGNISLTGAIGGAGKALTKVGNGTVILSNTSTYTGATTVSSGALIVNGSINNSVAAVQGGGSIGGNGSVGGLILADGGTLSPGNSPGTFNVAGDATWNSGSNYNWQVYATNLDPNNQTNAGISWDLVDISGTLTLSGLDAQRMNLNLWTAGGAIPFFDPEISNTWLIASTDGGINLNGSSLSANNDYTSLFNVIAYANNGTSGWTGDLPSGGFRVVTLGNTNNLYLQAIPGTSPVPEPGQVAASLLLLASAGAYMFLKRRPIKSTLK